jgi:hypothetical protein
MKCYSCKHSTGLLMPFPKLLLGCRIPGDARGHAMVQAHSLD